MGAGFVTASITANRDTKLAERIVIAIKRELEARQAISDRLRTAFESLTLTVGVPGFELQWQGRPSVATDALPFETALAQMARQLREDDSAGIAVLIDELQEASPDDLRTLLPALQEFSDPSAGVPIVFFGAGLISLPRTLARTYGFAERFEYRTLDRLDDKSAGLAFRAGLDVDVEWLPGSLETAVELAAGHPYLIQLIGYHAWEESSASTSVKPGILPGDIRAAEQLARGDLLNVFRARWHDTADVEREVLSVLAQSDSSTVAELVRVVPRDAREVEGATADLYDDGWVDILGLHEMRFAYPGLREFVIDRTT